jgi:hypothetical protein
MSVQITNNGASLKIVDGTETRNIMKNQILEIAVIKTNVIKIDIGKGALNNVFINFPDVTVPVAADPGALRDAINDMLASTLTAGTATEAHQLEEIAKLNIISDNTGQIKNSVSSLDSKFFIEPTLIDESNPLVIYKGYALPAADPAGASWAIQKITNTSEVLSYQWANGNKNFTNIWNDRLGLAYS